MPSQQLSPVFEGLAEKYKGRARVVSVDVTPSTERLCRAYKIDRLPVVMLFKDGEPRDFIGGATDEANIADMLETHLKPTIELSEFNFEREVVKSKVPVLIHFWAAWCKQSLVMDEVIRDVATKFRGRAKVGRLEMRPENARLFARYNVSRVPTTAVLHHGEIQDQIFGAMTGGTKVGAVQTSCVGLTSLDNVSQMLERFVM